MSQSFYQIAGFCKTPQIVLSKPLQIALWLGLRRVLTRPSPSGDAISATATSSNSVRQVQNQVVDRYRSIQISFAPGDIFAVDVQFEAEAIVAAAFSTCEAEA